jgi:adenine deaminase
VIEPHIHPEVTKLTITRTAEVLLSKGTTTIMCSFDQIGVIAGIEGIRFTLDEVKNTPLKVFYCGPSRLPYTTPASTVAFDFGPEEHREAMQWDETVGMWEYMIDSIATLEKPVLEAANELLDKGKRPQGHLPFTSGPLLAGAIAAGAATDHESWSTEQVAEKLRAGMYVLLRKASCVDNFSEGLKAVTEMGLPSRRLCLCADDVDCTDLVELGHVDHFIRYAVQLGIEPLHVIQMATLTAAEAFRVDHLVGSLTPGRIADVLLVEDLNRFTIQKVFADGKLVAENGECIISVDAPSYPQSFYRTMKLDKPITEKDIYITAPEKASKAHVLVMNLESNQVRTRRETHLEVNLGRIMPQPDVDVLYISVTDRHSGKGRTASAFISGFGLKNGAFATSLSPDDDNIICIGTSVPDMVIAINHVFKIGGGQAVVDRGRVIADIELPVCGIMANVTAGEMAKKEKILRQSLFDRGSTIPKPFFSILFLSITAIPEYSLTDRGFVEAKSRQTINPVISWA